MIKYIIPKGTRIWLSPLEYDDMPFVTEREMTFDESDLLEAKHSISRGVEYFIFRLPPNERHYDTFEIWASDVIVQDTL